MDAILANLPPALQAQIIEEHERQLAAAASAAREQAAAEAARVDATVRNLQGAPAVTALLKHNTNNKSTTYAVRKDLTACIEAIDSMDAGNSTLVSDFREKLRTQLSTLRDSGYASNKVKTEIQHALELLGVQISAPPLALGWNGEASDDDEEEEEVDEEPAAPAPADAADEEPAERPQPPPAADAPDVIREAFSLIMSSVTMRRSIRFDLAPFLLRVHDNVCRAMEAREANGLLPAEQTIKMFGGGRTQARKTPLKAAQFILCRMMGVPTILLTTNVAGREDLFKKFSELLAEIDVPTPPLMPAGTPLYAGTEYEYRKVHGVQKLVAVGREAGAPGVKGVLSVDTISNTHRPWAVSQLRQGACIVCNNTAPAMRKLSSIVREARGDHHAPPLQFMLTIDEADDFYRTDGDSNAPIKLEQALQELKELGPLVCFEVSATLLAVFMALHREGGAEAVAAADLWYVEPCDDYVGAELLMPPQDARGEYQFLAEHDLKKSNVFADPKVRATYADAAAKPKALLLDATTSAVTAANQIGLFDKAKLVQGLHPNAVIVVVSGSLIKWWTVQPRADRPGDYNGTLLQGKARIVGNAIAKIDKYYPDRPIFVFGYSQMVRGVSYRSRRRVPSHFVLLYKSGMPLCRLVQAAGRAMGEQARQLRKNGFNHVVMLTQPQDYDAICAYPEFLKAIKRQMEGGASLAAALGATYEAKHNVFCTPKELGAKRLRLSQFVQTTLQFAPTTTPIGDGSAALDRELGTHGRGPRRAILEVLLDCDCLEDEYAIGGKDVHEELATGAYDEMFGDADTTLTVAEVTKILKELCLKPAHRAPVVESIGAGKSLKFFVNQEGLDALPGRTGAPLALAAPADDDDDDGDDDDGGGSSGSTPMLLEVAPQRQSTITRRERELQAAQEAAESDEELHAAMAASGAAAAAAVAAAAGAGPSGVSWPTAAVSRSRRGAAAAAAARMASCAVQLQMDESCDERPEDLLPAFGKRKLSELAANNGAVEEDEDF